MKPNVFIGSSAEARYLVDVLTQELSDVAQPKPWTNSNLFNPGDYTLPRLLDEAHESDFAILLLSPDDKTNSRGTLFQAARDNVLLELGLFMSVLDLNRAYVLIADTVKVPTDLMGLTVLSYDHDRSKADPSAALANAVAKIRTQIRNKGARREREDLPKATNWKNWKYHTGDWKRKKTALELSPALSSSDAAYAWSPQPLHIGGIIEFSMSFESRINADPVFDFRLALFAASQDTVRSGPDHYLIVAPWSGDNPVSGGEDMRVDYIAAGIVMRQLAMPLWSKFTLRRKYAYRVIFEQNYIRLDIDNVCRLLWPIDVNNALQGHHDFWGFSSHTAHLKINDLKTNLS